MLQLVFAGPKVSGQHVFSPSVLAARPRRPRGLLETMEIGEGRARLGERTHFSDPGRLSREGGPGSIHSQTQPLSLVWPSLAALSGGASSGAPFEGIRS